jgi:hypothetical protein
MRVSNNTKCVQVFGSTQIQPGQQGVLDEAWAPRLKEYFEQGLLLLVSSHAPRSPSPLDLLNYSDPNPEQETDPTPLDSYHLSRFKTREKFIRNCADIHVLKTVLPLEKNDKLKAMVASQIASLEAT